MGLELAQGLGVCVPHSVALPLSVGLRDWLGLPEKESETEVEEVLETEVLTQPLAVNDDVTLALTHEVDVREPLAVKLPLAQGLGVCVPLAEKLPLRVGLCDWLALSE